MSAAEATQQDPSFYMPSMACACLCVLCSLSPLFWLFLSLCCDLAQRGEQRSWASLQKAGCRHTITWRIYASPGAIVSQGWMRPQEETLTIPAHGSYKQALSTHGLTIVKTVIEQHAPVETKAVFFL